MKLLQNKYFLLGNLLLILLAIPLTLFLVDRQQDLQGSAAPLTTLSISPSNVTGTTCSETISMDVMVDPDQNLVSIVDMYVVYDSTKLDLTEIEPNTTAFPLTLRGPVYSSGSANVSLSIGSDVTKAIQTQTKVATLNFTPVASTSAPTIVSIDGTQSRVFSLSSSDGPSENVLLNAVGSSVTITQQADCTVSPTPTGPTPTGPTPTGPTPTAPSSVTPTTPPGGSATPTVPTPTTPGGGGNVTPTKPPATPTTAVNQIPVCTSLALDRAASGSAPFSIAFTANGTDPNGTISKVSFNFGEGPVQDLTQGGGIGTKTVAAQSTHTYNSAGTFQASVILTDNNGAISTASASCAQTITVNAAPTQSVSPIGTQPTPTIESPGSILTTVGIIGGVVLTIIGGIVFFIL